MGRCRIPELNFGTQYKIDCIRDGDVVWTETVDNLVVNTGLEYAMGRVFGIIEQGTLYMGLCTDATVTNTDTALTHSFVEFLGTVNSRRPIAEFTDGGLVPDNKYTYVAPDIQVMISSSNMIMGAFLTTGQIKGEDTGTLYGVAPFSGGRSVEPGDALLTTITVSAKG